MSTAGLPAWEQLKLYLEILNHVFVILGIVLAIILYAKRQLEHFYEKLNDKYLTFLELQLQHPGLGTNTSDRDLVAYLTGTPESAAQAIIFDYLLSLLERAYLFLGSGIDSWTPWKASEWRSWKGWIQAYKKNPNFVKFWDEIQANACYTEKFVKFLNAELKREAKSA